jgi:hypothetical protein
MQVFGDMSLAALGQLAQESPGDAAAFTAKVLDTDGDGRSDLFLLDADNDGTVDGVVRGLDANGDGQNDTYVTYNEDGSIRSIGRVDEMGNLDVVWEEPGVFDQMLAGLGLVDLKPPEEALFTSFDDPYVSGTYGEYSDDLPADLPEVVIAQPSDVTDLDAADYEGLSSGAAVIDQDAESPEHAGPAAISDETANDAGATEPAGEQQILEVEDTGDGWLRARIDADGDGLEDRTQDLQRTVDGWEADVDQDGLKETVAFDADRDGRVDSVDRSGTGDWAGSAQAWEVVDQPSDVVDDGLFEGEAESAVGTGVAADSGAGASCDTSVDTSVDTSSSYEPDAGYDAGSTSDSGGLDES